MTAVCTLSYSEITRAWREYLAKVNAPGSVHWRAESFRSSQGEAMTIRRAKALNAVLDNCPLHIIPGELLFGIGFAGRNVVPGTYSAEAIAADVELVNAIGERYFGVHSDHHASDYRKLVRLGLGGLKAEVRASMPRQDEKGRLFLESMLVALEGASAHLRRWGAALAQAAKDHQDHAELLRQQSAMAAKLAEDAPTTFHEALQLILCYHLMMQLDNRAAMAFGRLDQFLLPFYQEDLKAGRVSVAEMQDTLDHFFAKVTMTEDVQNIALAGVDPCSGEDATNEVSYMILEACKRVGQPGGNCTVRVTKNTPMAFLEKCAEVIRTGIGYPALYNDEIGIKGLLDSGYPLADARDYCFAGCIEIFIPGKQGPWADNRLNPLHAVSLALFRGRDILANKQLGLDTGDPQDFEAFYQAFLAQAKHESRQKVEEWNRAQQDYDNRAMDFTAPLLSSLVSDCIARGRDVNDGGAIYPANCGFGCMGIGSVSDALAAVKKFVYDERRFSLAQMRAMLEADFEGFEKERQLLLNGAPKYGNDNEEVDSIAVRFVTEYANSFKEYRTPSGGHYWLLMAANISNIWGGSVIGATPDGRHARMPLSDAASPNFGRDKNGPTATARSVSKLPYYLCAGGNVVNMKLSPSSLKGDGGLKNLASFIRACFDMGGVQLQFNTNDREMLKKAMANPGEFADLVVRVSGFSAKFTTLDKAVQNDILSRTEHSL